MFDGVKREEKRERGKEGGTVEEGKKKKNKKGKVKE